MNQQETILDIIRRTLAENADAEATAQAVHDAIQPHLAVSADGGGISELGENGTVGANDDVLADVWHFEVRPGGGGGIVECAHIVDGERDARNLLETGKTVRLNLYVDDGHNMLTGDVELTKTNSVEGRRQDGFWRTRFEFVTDTPMQHVTTDAESWHFMKPDPSRRTSREE